MITDVKVTNEHIYCMISSMKWVCFRKSLWILQKVVMKC